MRSHSPYGYRSVEIARQEWDDATGGGPEIPDPMINASISGGGPCMTTPLFRDRPCNNIAMHAVRLSSLVSNYVYFTYFGRGELPSPPALVLC